MTSVSLLECCRRIDALVLDVDGVLTDGSVLYTDQGAEIKAFHSRDGAGLKYWLGLGKKAGIITGRRSSIVERRVRELGITEVVQGVDEKKPAFLQMLPRLGVSGDRACYVGDDLVDLAVFGVCGLPVTVADASPDVRDAAAYVTRAPGGRGAVREVIEWILRAQGSWQAVLARARDA